MRRSTVVAISLGACQSFCYWINLWDLASSSNAFMASSVGGLVSGTRPGKRPDTVAESSFNPSSLGLALGITPAISNAYVCGLFQSFFSWISLWDNAGNHGSLCGSNI